MSEQVLSTYGSHRRKVQESCTCSSTTTLFMTMHTSLHFVVLVRTLFDSYLSQSCHTNKDSCSIGYQVLLVLSWRPYRCTSHQQRGWEQLF